MRVKIGPYRNWIGPYQVADWLQYVGVSEDRCGKIGDWLTHTWFCNFCVWIDNRKNRKIKIKIHDYDTWSLDHTLALIILPALKQLKKEKHGVPGVDLKDLPEELQFKDFKRNEDYPDWGCLPFEYQERQWNWIMDEMINSFEKMVDNNNRDWEYDEKECARIDNGLKLFGIYYRALWD